MTPVGGFDVEVGAHEELRADFVDPFEDEGFVVCGVENPEACESCQ